MLCCLPAVTLCDPRFVFQTRRSECRSAAAHQRDADEVAPVSGSDQHELSASYSLASVVCWLLMEFFSLFLTAADELSA